MPLFKLNGAELIRGGNVLLKEAYSAIYKGDKVVVMGRNGAGKSTFVRLLAGLERPSHGELLIGGIDSRTMDVRQLRKSVSYVSSSLQDRFLGNVTTFEVVLTGTSGDLAPYWHSYSDEEISRAERLLCTFRLADKRNHLFNTLSQGERQKTVLARAFAQQSQLVVADEPFVGLDLVTRDELIMAFEELGEIGLSASTVVLVVHGTEEIPRAFDKVVFIRNSELVWQGSKADFLRPELLSELYETPLNVFEVNYRYYASVEPRGSMS